MSLTLVLSAKQIDQLDLSPGHRLVELLLQDPARAAQQVQCVIDYPRALDDPRELSEIPAIRLWFIYFDGIYPWIPYFLDWRQGELVRYAAMMVPHQFRPKEGIQFNPEALEIFLYQKIFAVTRWLKANHLGDPSVIQNMALMFGFEVKEDFLQLWEDP